MGLGLEGADGEHIRFHINLPFKLVYQIGWIVASLLERAQAPSLSAMFAGRSSPFPRRRRKGSCRAVEDVPGGRNGRRNVMIPCSESRPRASVGPLRGALQG